MDVVQQLVNGVFLGSIYAVFAVGYTLVFGVLGVVNLAHSGVFMLAAAITYGLVAFHGAPLWLAAPAGLLAAAGLGLVIELGALRPLRRRQAPEIAPLISTIGLSLVFVALVEQSRGGGWLSFVWRDGANSVRFPAGTVPDRVWHVGRLAMPADKVATVVISVLLMAVLGVVVNRTQVGRAMRAVAENPRAACLLGIDVDRIVLWTVVASSAMAGLAGILYGVTIGDISPYIGRDQVELRGLAVIVLGGVGSIRGSIVAAYLLGTVEVLALLGFGANVRAAVAFAALFGMLVVRPGGLFASPAAERA